jgi:GNAT superfamily N-acetyltransferase
MPLLIRPAVPDDAKAIARVHVASWQEAYRSILPTDFLANLSVEKRQAMWTESIRIGLPHVLTAEIAGELVGFSAIGASRDDADVATAYEVWAIYVAPTQWGTGIGRALWLASRQFAVAHGARTISVWVIATNERAIRFYLAAGFRPAPDSCKPETLAGVEIEEIQFVHSVEG